MFVKVAQSCLTVCNPRDYTVHGILQARILEWIAFPFSRGSSQPRDRTQVSCIADRRFTVWATIQNSTSFVLSIGIHFIFLYIFNVNVLYTLTDYKLLEIRINNKHKINKCCSWDLLWFYRDWHILYTIIPILNMRISRLEKLTHFFKFRYLWEEERSEAKSYCL